MHINCWKRTNVLIEPQNGPIDKKIPNLETISFRFRSSSGVYTAERQMHILLTQHANMKSWRSSWKVWKPLLLNPGEDSLFIATKPLLSNKTSTNPNQTSSSWWLNQPQLKNMLVKMGSIFPKFRGENKKYLSCHHLVIVSSILSFRSTRNVTQEDPDPWGIPIHRRPVLQGPAVREHFLDGCNQCGTKRCRLDLDFRPLLTSSSSELHYLLVNYHHCCL